MSFFFSSYHQNLDKIAFNGTTESMNLQKVFSIIIISIMSIAGISDNPIKIEQEYEIDHYNRNRNHFYLSSFFIWFSSLWGFSIKSFFDMSILLQQLQNVQICRYALYFRWCEYELNSNIQWCKGIMSIKWYDDDIWIQLNWWFINSKQSIHCSVHNVLISDMVIKRWNHSHNTHVHQVH